VSALAGMTAPRAQARSHADDLLERARTARQQQPGLRTRDVAAVLGVSEGELVAADCGRSAVRLARRWPELLQALPTLGRVMALTRNEYIVHEKHGTYGSISISGSMALVLDHEIDLRIFFDRWAFAFAVEEASQRGPRRSIQIFDCDGTAVHKVHLVEGSDAIAFATLVVELIHQDQSPFQAVEPRPAPKPARPDAEIDAAGLRARWLALKDVHDFFAMLKDSGAGREQAFRLVGPDLAPPVPPGSFRRALERAAAGDVPVMVFVPSPGVIQIHTGPVRNLKTLGPWFNVLDEGFNLHFREEGVAGAWVVRKPTTEGVVTSVEIYDAEGRQLGWIFGKRKPGEPEREDWRALVDALVAEAR
jgi:putative hemin transport protein